ncbi:MAG: tRNA uridine-5-carboxymethylaminomethyl(34) synthesis GTPase MnmE [Deltaproteobacteria bacterium]|nr:tRNA uridine-5-carboxymethylaminomethyl(34) synthesis GTPase MnmE [Deltaproteobacteria bacterium]
MTDTIAAIATPPGTGAIGIIRLTGPKSRTIAERIFTSSSPCFDDFRPRFLHHGIVTDESGSFLDDVLIAHLPGPASFSGEDMIEIFAHGGQTVLQTLLERILACGARLADPGEFTKRAFLNGKMDLTQAEAIAELISAPTKAALILASAKRAGALKDVGERLRRRLETVLAHLFLAIDFTDDEAECIDMTATKTEVQSCLEMIEALERSGRRAYKFREGCLVVIAGQVNVGKSSLMNSILGRQRAIVTDFPGTTRDYIEETIDLEGIPVRLVDTAGFRSASDKADPVEEFGIHRTQELVSEADTVVFMYDVHQGMTEEDWGLIESFSQSRPCILAGNKIDLMPDLDDTTLRDRDRGPHILISAKFGRNVDTLLDVIRRELDSEKSETLQGTIAPNARQLVLLGQARIGLDHFLIDLRVGQPLDILAGHVQNAVGHLSEITGRIAPDDVLHRIFADFCIGK